MYVHGRALSIAILVKVCVCVCGHHFQQTGHQPGMVANPTCGQLNRENGIFFSLSFFVHELVSSRVGPLILHIIRLNLVLFTGDRLPLFVFRYGFH